MEPNSAERSAAAEPVASVSSPSTNSLVRISVSADGREVPLVGTTVAVRNRLGDGEELAIGAVTEVTTRNKFHEDVTFTGLQSGLPDPEMSGDEADLRYAEVSLQAAWRRGGDGGDWIQSGPFLRMSPATGTPVAAVDAPLVSEIVAGTPDLHYCGHLGGTQGVPLPLNVPDFSGPLGSFHTAVFGRSGAGKTAAASYVLASLMRHPGLGVLCVDPQGQYQSETGLPFSLQGFAAELGRPVRVHRISEDLRLEKDASLFVSLLACTEMLRGLGRMSPETHEILYDEIKRIVRATDDWEALNPGDLLRAVLEQLRDERVATRVYSGADRRELFVAKVGDALEGEGEFNLILSQFAPIHNLFATTNAHGGRRHRLWGVLGELFDRRGTDPAPYVVLDMSSKPPPGMDDEMSDEVLGVYEILERSNVKAAILRNVLASLKRASEQKFRDGDNLNTLIVLDEAWRFAAPPSRTEDEEARQLSADLAGYARDTRKFGIGWFYISQSPFSINSDIWEQLSVRVFGFGLTGHDLSRVEEIVADRSSLRLYRAFGDPRATGTYPFLLTGPVSPLVANNAPLVLETFTSFDDFRAANRHWIQPARDALGEPVLSGAPTPPHGSAPRPKRAPRSVPPAKAAREIAETNARIRENRVAIGLTDPHRDPYSLDGEEAPF